VVANRFLRCSGSRENIHTLIQALCAAVVQHRVNPMRPRITEKAVGLEPHIGSWLALKPTLSLRSFGTERRRAPLTS
jgi:hypothetical protein